MPPLKPRTLRMGSEAALIVAIAATATLLASQCIALLPPAEDAATATEDAAWAVYQAQADLLRLRGAVQDAIAAPAVHTDDVTVRYAAAAGRIALLREGATARVLAEGGVPPTRIEALGARVADLAPLVAATAEGAALAAGDLLAGVRALDAPLQDLTLAARNAAAADGETARTGALWWRDLIVALGVGLVPLVLLPLASLRGARRQRAALQARAADVDGDRPKSDFLATISHEIRAPMNGIAGVADLMQHADLPDEERGIATTLARSAQSLLAIVNDVLDVSRLEHGKLTLRAAPFDLAEVVGTVIELFMPQASARGLLLEAHLPETGVPQLLGDAGRLRQVLLNLVGNAIKFTESGGVLVEVVTTPSGDGRILVHVAVRDSGIGIAPEQQRRLFKTPRPAETGDAQRLGGTGLGLAISHRLLDLMGGTIGVASVAGRGSTFGVTVPLPRAPLARDTAALPPRTMPRLRVLVVEDTPTNQVLISAMLARLGQIVRMAGTGAEAIEAIRAGGQFDLVLMDVEMPGMDGYATTRAIRALPAPAGDVPVVALTATHLPGHEALCQLAGMNDHVAKPVTLAGLAALLGRWAPHPDVANDAPPPA